MCLSPFSLAGLAKRYDCSHSDEEHMRQREPGAAPVACFSRSNEQAIGTKPTDGYSPEVEVSVVVRYFRLFGRHHAEKAIPKHQARKRGQAHLFPAGPIK